MSVESDKILSKKKLPRLPSRIKGTIRWKKTLRPKSPGAEKWLFRPIKCLDHGFVYLVDYMGNDVSVEQAARVSYGVGTRKVSQTEGLIRYLRRRLHTTPSEMVEFKFHCQMPIFVARQWVRHRTANINEYSGRYSIMPLLFYTPEHKSFSSQAKGNRQGREEQPLSEKVYTEALERWERLRQASGDTYEWLLGQDVARELARIDLPLSVYTQWYWKIDLHNLMHFLALRLDEDAQYEIQVFAQAIARIVKDAVPLSYKAFEDYQLYGGSLSRLEREFIALHDWPLKNKRKRPLSEKEAWQLVYEQFGNKGETNEFIAKLKELRLLR